MTETSSNSRIGPHGPRDCSLPLPKASGRSSHQVPGREVFHGNELVFFMWRKNLLLSLLLLFAATALLAWLKQSSRLEAMIERPLPPLHADARAEVAFGETLEAINQQFRDAWAEQGLPTAARADELIVARRLALALVGAVPSLEEIRAFERIPAEQRMDWWLNHLLNDRRHADYLAERLARAFVGTDQGPFVVFRRRRFVNWLSDELVERTPYDALVRELLSSRGIWTNNPAVNFVTATVDEGTADPIRLAGRTSRAFLGMRIDCLQCHDDFLGQSLLGNVNDPHGGTQQDFHQLAAFFSEVQISPAGVTDQRGKSYQYQYLNSEEEVEVLPLPPLFPGELLGGLFGGLLGSFPWRGESPSAVGSLGDRPRKPSLCSGHGEPSLGSAVRAPAGGTDR
jgi:hypothetical protein